MEFGVLGPVEIWVRGRPADAGHAKQRSVLAVLLLNLGRVVPAGELIDRVWGQDPPPSVRHVLYGYIGRLRAVIAAAGDPAVTLARCQGGYLLQAMPDQLDLGRFRRLVAQAAAGSDDDRAAALRAALALWRGTALAGLSSPWLDSMRQTLELERLAATLDFNDIALRQGRHNALVSELAGQAAAHPSDERLIAQLMLAQYRCGRLAESLATYRNAHQMLAEELGADPGAELHDIHQRILTADPSLDLPRHPGSASLPSDNAPADSGLPAGASRRDAAGRTRDGTRAPRWLKSRVTLATLAAAILAIAVGAVLVSGVVSGTPHITRPAAATGNWQCGPSSPVRLHDGSAVGQSLRACIASDHGHLELKGVLQGSVDAWAEQIVLIVTHPGPVAGRKFISPPCNRSTCTYQVEVNPGPGSWRLVPQWHMEGHYQSTVRGSPTVTV